MDLPPSPNAVDEMFVSYKSVRGQLPQSAVTDAISLDAYFAKLLLLGTASFLESSMLFRVDEYFRTFGTEPYEFTRRHGIERMFSRWFNFDQAMPKQFFNQFGKACATRFEEATQNGDFAAPARSFLLLCSERNLLVHRNLAEASLALTPAEIEAHYRLAIQFPELAIRVVQASS